MKEFLNYIVTDCFWVLIIIGVCILVTIALLILVHDDNKKSKDGNQKLSDKAEEKDVKEEKVEENTEPVTEETTEEKSELVKEEKNIKETKKATKKAKKVEETTEEKLEEKTETKKEVAEEEKDVSEVKNTKKTSTTKKADLKPAVKETISKRVEKEEKKEVANAKYRLIYDKENASWVIRKDGAGRTIRRVKTKQEALDILKNMEEKNEEMKVVVHKKNGKFQKH
ncbi:MAG: DUF2188 domain-containing protein [Christensenellales bacterium]